jgi:hypothetical protein
VNEVFRSNVATRDSKSEYQKDVGAILSAGNDDNAGGGLVYVLLPAQSGYSPELAATYNNNNTATPTEIKCSH